MNFDPDKSTLQALVNTAKSKSNIGYTAISWQALQAQITAAESFLNTTGYTQSQIDAQVTALQSALDSLVLLPDTSALQVLIQQAESIQNDNYTNNSWNAFQSALISAKALVSSSDYTASQVSSAQSALQSAINGLAFNLPDSTELQGLLVEADTITDIGYTESTWNRFSTARINAHSLLARPAYTAVEVQTASTELRFSMNGLLLQSSPENPSIPAGSEKYLDIASGFSIGHLAPVQDAIMQNLAAGRKYGAWVYIMMLIPLITVIMLRRVIHVSGEAENIDLNVPSHRSKAYKGNIIKPVQTGEKYTDW